jgi:hypothetical protein
MRTIIFSDNYPMEVQFPSEDNFLKYKYRIKELFGKLLTPTEARNYRKRIIESGLNITNVNFWATIKADASTSIPGDSLEKLSDALGIPMRDLKYRD